MLLESTLAQRCGSVCELCGSSESLEGFAVGPNSDGSAERSVVLCAKCRAEIEGSGELDVTHWRCLNESIWSTVPAVQVTAWRMLKRLTGETWAQDLLETVYLDEETLQWAQSGVTAPAEDDDKPVATVDSNGNVLQTGDSVTLIKDLVVKGGGFTAKRGTLVKNIQLTSNPKHVEGKVNGTVIVLVAAYLKKAN
ncbi:MAG: PhnA domain-containing protein [Planctomycetaceae bacterium]|nr:PhnA domain-containing protein [Planctomycetaceae bacterium]